MRSPLLAVLMVLVTPLALLARDDKKPADKRPTNRLARESSPYLRQHAHNPVDWYPWGPEAFAKAKKEGKLVFLSIGYSSCHWCHVMERESFDDPEIAKLMNQWFVCIKVDREERPDIDHVYMTALHVFNRRGGWPLSMFLTADGKPIIGGTYWPPEDKVVEGQKITGFKSILKAMHDLHQEKQKELEAQAERIADATRRALAGNAFGRALVELDRRLIDAGIEELKSEFDPVHGGFGSPLREFQGPKFPTPPYLRFLQYEAARTGSKELAGMVTLTLDRMARGGIYDHLGGGFHRYSTERTWTVPHFEKMLYDNAQLAEVYAAAYRATQDPLCKKVLHETLAFVLREMTSPEGGFYSALDADTAGEEGRTYVWTAQELDEALGKEGAGLIKQVYSADGSPNFEEKYFILHLPKPLAERAKELKLTEAQLETRLVPLREKLFAVRSRREQPFLDTKILTGWNGQMIAGFAAAGEALEHRPYLDAAARAAELVLTKLRTREGRLLRSYAAAPGEKPEARINAYLDDYAYLVHGLLHLHDATGKKKWLDQAKALTDTMVQHHHDPEGGGFFYTAHDSEKLFARAKDQYDGAQPSGNSVAVQNLVRLWVKTKDDRYRDLAEQTLKTFSGTLKNSPSSLTAMLQGLGLLLDAKK